MHYTKLGRVTPIYSIYGLHTQQNYLGVQASLVCWGGTVVIMFVHWKAGSGSTVFVMALSLIRHSHRDAEPVNIALAIV